MERRDFLRVSLTGLGAVAAFFGSIPFVKSFLPSAKAKALGNPIEVDLSQIEPGTVQAHLYRGETMLVLRRTKEMLATLATTDALVLDKTPDPDYTDPEYIDRENRAINPEFLIVRGVCTHLGCVPVLRGADGKQTVGELVARRVHLPVPSIRLRLRRPRRARARTSQPSGAAAPFRKPDANRDRRGADADLRIFVSATTAGSETRSCSRRAAPPRC